jgi:hypothetical protein
MVLALLVVVAGAFAAGALIFRDGEDRKLARAQIRCLDDGEEDENGDPVGWNEGCDDIYDEELRLVCAGGDPAGPEGGVDAVEMTIIYEYETPPRATVEDSRRTYTEDC